MRQLGKEVTFPKRKVLFALSGFEGEMQFVAGILFLGFGFGLFFMLAL